MLFSYIILSGAITPLDDRTKFLATSASAPKHKLTTEKINPFIILCVISGCNCPLDPLCSSEQVLLVNPEDERSCCPRKTCGCPPRDILVCIPPKILKHTNHTYPQPYCTCECPDSESNCTGMLGCQLKGTKSVT